MILSFIIFCGSCVREPSLVKIFLTLVFFLLEFSRLRKYLLFLSHISYQVARECIMAPCVIKSYRFSYSAWRDFSSSTFCWEGSLSHLCEHSFIHSSTSCNCAFLSRALVLLKICPGLHLIPLTRRNNLYQ